ncbi:MAG: hypothetical protein JSR46_03205, partial [Verrucomicrobia bacterium]|nr:hypothetical protein [Verrucomicrobiota bacterium]
MEVECTSSYPYENEIFMWHDHSPEKQKIRSFDDENSGGSPIKIRKIEAKTGLSPEFKGLSVANGSRSRPSSAKRSLLTDLDAVTHSLPDPFCSLIEDCKKALSRSLDGSRALEERMQFLPKLASPGTASGSYITYSTDKVPALVVKPTNQEAGAVDCPGGKGGVKPGIEPGESAIRELLARKV